MSPPSALQGLCVVVLWGVGAAVGWAASRQLVLFSVHAVAMAAAFLGLPPAAILSIMARHRSRNASTRRALAMLHAALQCLSVASATVGLSAIYANKERMGKPHFQSTHAWAGLTALAAFALMAASGLGTSLVVGKGWLWRDPLHRAGGTVAVGAGAVAVALGLRSGWAVAAFGDAPASWMAWAVVAAVAAERGWAWVPRSQKAKGG